MVTSLDYLLAYSFLAYKKLPPNMNYSGYCYQQYYDNKAREERENNGNTDKN